MASARLGMVAVVMVMSLWSGAGSGYASSSGTVTLFWTAPGDDGHLGAATSYDLRVSTVPITESNFYSCTQVANVPRPLTPGAMQIVPVPNLAPDGTYFFAVRTADERGNWSGMSNVAVHSPYGTTSTEPGGALLVFSSPSPNPAMRSTRFRLDLARTAWVRVEAFDLSGRRVRTLLDGRFEAGEQEISWDLRDENKYLVQAGVYLVRAMMPGMTFTRRIVVMR